MYQISMSRPLPLTPEKIHVVSSLEEAKEWLETNRVIYGFDFDLENDAADCCAGYLYNKNMAEVYSVERIKD